MKTNAAGVAFWLAIGVGCFCFWGTTGLGWACVACAVFQLFAHK